MNEKLITKGIGYVKFFYIPKVEDYMVSQCGKVWSQKGNRLLFQHNSYGYWRISMTSGNRKRTVPVHRLIAAAFLGLDFDDSKSVVDHKDRNSLNNDISNLRVVSHRENLKNKVGKGVRLLKNGRWTATVKSDGKRKHLGCFSTEEEAHNSYLIHKVTIGHLC